MIDNKNKTPDDLEVAPEQEEDEVYIEYDIATYPSDFTLGNIFSMWNEGHIEVPDFQRNYVWNIKQASLLIESFLLGLPVPPVFLYIDDETQKSLVIDGQQRIKSIVQFFEGYWGEESTQGKQRVFRLYGLSDKSPHYKKNFDDLSEADKRKLSNSVLRALNIRQLKPRDDNTSIYHIFERLNTGGTPLRPQEIRNCVFRGKLVSELYDLNCDDNWRNVIGKPNEDKHQKDIELILRLFALSKYNSKEYEKPMKEFLNKTMEQNRNAKSQDWKKFSGLFNNVCELIITELGDKPFHVRGPLNVSVLDSVFCVLIDRSPRKPKNFKQKYEKLVVHKAYIENTQVSTSDASVIQKRMELVEVVLFA